MSTTPTYFNRTQTERDMARTIELLTAEVLSLRLALIRERMWSKAKLQTKMRKTGWQRMDGPGSVYQHTETGKQVDLGQYENGRFAWEDYAERHEVPSHER